MQEEKIYDSHCHIYPDMLAPRAVASIDRFYEGLPVKSQDGTVSTLIQTGREQGISHYIVHSVATRPQQVSHINHFISVSVTSSRGSFTGLGTLHPLSEYPEEDFRELLSLGLSGVKLHPDLQKFRADDPAAMRIYELCEAHGLPVLLHTGDRRFDYSNPSRIVPILRRFPKLKLIGAHLGGWSVWEEAAGRLSDFPNFAVDTSSSFFWLKPEKVLELIRTYGSERVMFGTDYPMWMQKPELDYLKGLDLLQEEYENICWKTCSRMYGC